MEALLHALPAITQCTCCSISCSTNSVRLAVHSNTGGIERCWRLLPRLYCGEPASRQQWPRSWSISYKAAAVPMTQAVALYMSLLIMKLNVLVLS